jgi:hypothetical protein
MHKSVHTALCGLVLHAFPSLKWRHNGLGLLQAYLYEGVDRELRVHVWHKSLAHDGIGESGLIHDHRFNLTSHVLVGQIWQEEFMLDPDAVGPRQMHTVVHAREAMAKHAINDGDVQALPARYRASTDGTNIGPGWSYTFPKRMFHKTECDSPIVVTVVQKDDQEDVPARILAPYGKPVVHAFVNTLLPAAWSQPLALAEEALLRAFTQ